MRKVIITIITALVGVGVVIAGIIVHGRYTHSSEK